MSSSEILEWVMGWPWPVMIIFIVLIAAGIGRLISRDKQDLSEDQSSGPFLDKECRCERK